MNIANNILILDARSMLCCMAPAHLNWIKMCVCVGCTYYFSQKNGCATINNIFARAKCSSVLKTLAVFKVNSSTHERNFVQLSNGRKVTILSCGLKLKTLTVNRSNAMCSVIHPTMLIEFIWRSYNWWLVLYGFNGKHVVWEGILKTTMRRQNAPLWMHTFEKDEPQVNCLSGQSVRCAQNDVFCASIYLWVIIYSEKKVWIRPATPSMAVVRGMPTMDRSGRGSISEQQIRISFCWMNLICFEDDNFILSPGCDTRHETMRVSK